jgi:hypothetical protein
VDGLERLLLHPKQQLVFKKALAHAESFFSPTHVAAKLYRVILKRKPRRMILLQPSPLNALNNMGRDVAGGDLCRYRRDDRCDDAIG